jgi:hypothetical protein
MSRLETKKQSWRRQPQQSPASYSAGSIHWFTQSGHGRLRFPPIKCHHELDKIWERQQLFIWVTYTPFYGPEPSQTMLDKIWERRQLFIWVTYTTSPFFCSPRLLKKSHENSRQRQQLVHFTAIAITWKAEWFTARLDHLSLLYAALNPVLIILAL